MTCPEQAGDSLGGGTARPGIEALLEERWRDLPPSVRTDQQLAGRGGVACGATWGVMERCNFTCTSCYLTELGNQTPALPFDLVRAQLDTLRDHLGSGGKVQITSGEVTLLPVDDLGRIVRYALDVGLDPMVMTNGDRFRRDDGYLVRLVEHYGLRKISLHVDTTQKGRKWSPDGAWVSMPLGLREAELNPLRDRFAELVEDVARRTKTRLHAAHTVTVTPATLRDVSDIAAWALDRAAFRIVSFQPVAAVGRTEDTADAALTIDAVWGQIEAGIGQTLNKDAMLFGHPQCNLTVPFVAVAAKGVPTQIVEVVRQHSGWDRRVFRRMLEELSVHSDLDAGWMGNLRRALATCLRKPRFGLDLFAWIVARAVMEFPKALRVLVRGRLPRLFPMLFVIHKFMDADELDTEIGRERLDACVFKLPLEDGTLVSMCEMNASSLRGDLNSLAAGRPQAVEASS